MENTYQRNNRIAKNTSLLYLRMLLLMTLSLYTSRVVLNTLGVSDFGIYNAVGGFIAMFAVINGTLAGAISRFITYELGKNNIDQLKNIFSTSLNIQIGFAIIIFILAELIGIWFLNTQMNIPQERIMAARWVFQFSLIAFIVNMISVPYNAIIIAHEKMSAFAYISLLEAVLKLLIVLCLTLSPYDKLIIYSLLLLIVSIILRIIYGIYCKRQFVECKYSFSVDRKLFKDMCSFSGWNLFGQIVWISNTHGIGVIINIFFGVIYNAALSIANQINNVLKSFIYNFTTAINPQLTKSYAANELKYMNALIIRSSKYSAHLITIIGIPIFFEIDTILKIWLGDVPLYTSVFVRLYLIDTLFSSALSNALITGIMATGKLKSTQLSTNAVSVLILPLTYLAYKCNFGAYFALLLVCLTNPIILVFRLLCLKDKIDLKIQDYITKVIFPVIAVITISTLVILPIHNIVASPTWRLIAVVVVNTVMCIVSIYYISASESERMYFIDKLALLRRLKHN